MWGGSPSYLGHGADGVHLANQLAVRLEQEEELEVELVEALTQLQLLGDCGNRLTHTHWQTTGKEGKRKKLRRLTHTGTSTHAQTNTPNPVQAYDHNQAQTCKQLDTLEG